MTFEEVLPVLKAGGMIERAGWNGKGMFLYFVQADAYPARSDVAKSFWGAAALVPYRAYIALKTVTGEVVPWVASQSDILESDWDVIYENR